MRNNDYFSSNNWERVLPNGIAFCHWGGKRISKELVKKLGLKEREKVLDICCGQCGTLGLIKQKNVELYGLDISNDALRRARGYLSQRGKANYVKLILGDAFDMPFSRGFFGKLFAQDPDSFLSPRKEELMREIARVSKKGAKFVLQTYASTSNLSQSDKKKTDNMLMINGHKETETIQVEQLERLFSKARFRLQRVESLHDIYVEDNLEMIELAKKNRISGGLLDLLEHERYLFRKNAWTGILVESTKK